MNKCRKITLNDRTCGVGGQLFVHSGVGKLKKCLDFQTAGVPFITLPRWKVRKLRNWIDNWLKETNQ